MLTMANLIAALVILCLIYDALNQLHDDRRKQKRRRVPTLYNPKR